MVSESCDPCVSESCCLSSLKSVVFVELLGVTLLSKEGDSVVERRTEDLLGGKKHVMLYFSANWCPPCKTFTPELSKKYSDSFDRDKSAIVFISEDRDQNAFDEYYSSMSFFALPFSEREKQVKLANMFGAERMPTLVLLDRAGSLIDSNLRDQSLSRFYVGSPEEGDYQGTGSY